MSTPDVIIIGAGPAGLACSAPMRTAGLNVTVLDKAGTVGSVWRLHYDRLHLHTDRNHSGLPGMAMPRDYPTYPSRAQVVTYLEVYARHFDIRPRFNTDVQRVARNGEGWRVETDAGEFLAPVVVVATGIATAPYRPSWPGIEAFRGSIIHSSEYRNASVFAGRRVLVVGFGNSGAEIALDLAEAGIDVALAVRSPVQIIPRGIDRMTAGGVVFADGTEEKFDAIILATRFRPDLRRLIPGEDDLFDQQGMPRVTGKPTTVPGLYFCGQTTVPTGQLREIGIKAQRIATSAKALLKSEGAPVPGWRVRRSNHVCRLGSITVCPQACRLNGPCS